MKLNIIFVEEKNLPREKKNKQFYCSLVRKINVKSLVSVDYLAGLICLMKIWHREFIILLFTTHISKLGNAKIEHKIIIFFFQK